MLVIPRPICYVILKIIFGLAEYFFHLILHLHVLNAYYCVHHHFVQIKNMSIKIEPGQAYLLDGKTVVTVLKAVNRSLTIFNVESANTVESVEADRLKPIEASLAAVNTQ